MTQSLLWGAIGTLCLAGVITFVVVSYDTGHIIPAGE